MKKFLSLIGLIAIMSMTLPAFASAPMHNPNRGHVVHAGAGMHRPPHHGGNWGAPPPPPPRGHYSRGHAVMGGVLVRRSCWNNYFYDSRMTFCDDYVVRPHLGGGIYIRF